MAHFTGLVDSRRQAGTTVTGGTSIWLELSEELEVQLLNLRVVGRVVLDELLKHKQSPLCPKLSTAKNDSTVTTAVFHHLLKWNVVACQQGRATNDGRHYAIFASAEDTINAYKSIGQQGKFTANWLSFSGSCLRGIGLAPFPTPPLHPRAK